MPGPTIRFWERVERQITALEHAPGLLRHALRCHHDDLLACPSFQEWFAAYPPNARAAAPPQ